MLLGNIFQQLYNVADTVIVGRFMGETALAAVGGAFPIMFMLNAVAVGMTTGTSILLSQLFGAKQAAAFQKTLYTTGLTMAVLALVLTAGGQLMIVPLLQLIDTPDAAMQESTIYLRFIFGGVIFSFAYNTFSAVFRSIGDSKTPLYFLILSSLINIALDLVFVVVFHWGVGGAAGATVLAQAISSVLCYLYICRKVPYLTLERSNCVFSWDVLRSVLRFGVPTMVQQLSVSASIMCVQGMVNQFDTPVMAGYSAASKVESLAMMPMFSISSALATFAAQNIGAGQPARAKQGLQTTVLLSAAVCGTLALIIYLLRYPLIVLFLKSDASELVYAFGCGYLGVVCIFYIVNATYQTLGGMLRGAGDTRAFMVISILTLVIRVGSSSVLLQTTSLGFSAIWWGLPISWAMGLVMCYARYCSGAWRHHAAVGS